MADVKSYIFSLQSETIAKPIKFAVIGTKEIELHRGILKDLGHNLSREFTILDFGCGDGEMVCRYRDEGFSASGVDIKLGAKSDFLRLIPKTGGYRIPFDDDTFDFVYSHEVFEHVKDLRSALSEIHRVLKPVGISLHIFPPKFRPIEAHVFVPFGGALQRYPWLLLWAFLGVRNSFQKDSTYKKVASRNYEYLRDQTSYRSKREVRNEIFARFHNVIFAERYFIKRTYGHARHIYPLVKVFPPIAWLYGSLHNRVVFFTKLSS